eukprot:UN28157
MLADAIDGFEWYVGAENFGIVYDKILESRTTEEIIKLTKTTMMESLLKMDKELNLNLLSNDHLNWVFDNHAETNEISKQEFIEICIDISDEPFGLNIFVIKVVQNAELEKISFFQTERQIKEIYGIF